MGKEPFSSRHNKRFPPGTYAEDSTTPQFANRLARLIAKYSGSDGIPNLLQLHFILNEVAGLRVLDFDDIDIINENPILTFGNMMEGVELYFLFDFIEELSTLFSLDDDGYLSAHLFSEELNLLLHTERLRYEYIRCDIVPLFPSPLTTLEGEVLGQLSSGIVGLATPYHMNKAKALFLARDYENCIKELVCALEALIKYLSGNENRKFAEFLKNDSRMANIHGSLKSLIIAFYGYASNEEGIRHGGNEPAHSTLDDVYYAYYQTLSAIELIIAKCFDTPKSKEEPSDV